MTTTRAIFREHGGPDVIQWQDEDLPAPGPAEVTIAHGAVGLNYIDTYHRRGIYPAELPSGMGLEAAGEIVAIGSDVRDFAIGDRVATFGPSLGAYATHRNIDAGHLFRLPDFIDDRIAAAAILKACTVEFLVERCAKVQAGWPVLVHAAAGGTGLLMVQWLKHIGAHVIGTVSTDEKADAARKAGADDIIFYKRENTAERVRELTDGAGSARDFRRDRACDLGNFARCNGQARADRELWQCRCAGGRSRCRRAGNEGFALQYAADAVPLLRNAGRSRGRFCAGVGAVRERRVVGHNRPDLRSA